MEGCVRWDNGGTLGGSLSFDTSANYFFLLLLLLFFSYSKNCKIGNRNCTYIAPAIPLRDRRLQESESHKPWQSMAAVIQLPVPSSTLPDPFRCLPIDMPLKSNELFQYGKFLGPREGLERTLVHTSIQPIPYSLEHS